MANFDFDSLKAPAKKLTSQEQAAKFAEACKEYGFDFIVYSDSVLRITKQFTPGDKEAFMHCDMDYGSVFALAPLRGGSIWGTDGGSIGGMSGLNNGKFVMNKSGEGVRFMRALRKLERGLK